MVCSAAHLILDAMGVETASTLIEPIMPVHFAAQHTFMCGTSKNLCFFSSSICYGCRYQPSFQSMETTSSDQAQRLLFL